MSAMTNFDVEQFIHEVKVRPILWNVTDPEYNHRQPRLSAWVEVASNMYIDSENWSNYDKFGKVREMQKRWKNIKDSYIRELKYEKKVRNGMVMAKKRKYLYSHLLGFLSEKKEKKKSDPVNVDVNENIKIEINTDDSCTMNEESYNSSHEIFFSYSEEDSQSTPQESFSNLPTQICDLELEAVPSTEPLSIDKTRQLVVNSLGNEIRGPVPSTEPLSNDKTKQLVVNSLGNEIKGPTPELSASGPPTSLELDDDKMFLMSLLPYFKKLKEDQKLQSRIQITKMIHDMLYNNLRF